MDAGITPIRPIEQIIDASPSSKAAQASSVDFQKMLKNSMDQINQMNADTEGSIEKLVSGEIQDIHQVMIAVEKANLTFTTMMQVRNKLLDAYREVMNMRF